ncbi:reverse transcriptase domain-containing protein [Tanacetum coccineum]
METISGDESGINSDLGTPIRRIDPANTPYSITQETMRSDEVKSKHLYSAITNEIDETKPELKDLPHHFQYAYLHGDKSFPIIISSKLSKKEKMLLLQVLEKHRGAFAWKMSDIKGISPFLCTYKILMEDDFKPVIQPQRRLNPKVQNVVKNEIVKPLNSGLIYPILHSSWVSPIHVVPKKGGMTVVLNDNNELIPSRTVTGWRVFFQISIAPEDQEETTFTCPYGTFAYRRMPFGLCNAPATFQRYMTAIFHDMVKDFMEVFMDDFSVFGQRIDGKFKPIYYARKTLNNAQEHYTTTEKELLVVVFSFDKFRPYLILSKTVVYTDHSALKYLFSKQDAKPRLIRLENPDLGVFTKEEIADEFPDEHLMMLKAKPNDDEPWYADYVNYIVGKIVPPRWTPKKEEGLRGPHSGLIMEERSTNQDSFGLVSLKMLEITVTHKLSTTYHPQTNGQIEVTNRAIKRILERSVGYNPKDWSEKLNDALWAFRTAYKTPMGCTPFRLVYGKACHLPVEIKHKAYWALKQCNMDLAAAAKNHFMELNELIELRDGAYENTRIYKERTKKWHDSRLRGDKDIKVRDKVLLFNSRLRMHPGKLKSKWYGPNVVKIVYPYGIVEITDKNGISFKVNGQRLKKYYDGHINMKDKDVVKFNEDMT